MSGSDRTRNPKAPTDARPLERDQPGYYPGYRTMAQQDYWDAATRATINARLAAPPPIRFLSAEEARTLQAVIERLLPQDDRSPEKRIPILPEIDKRLFNNVLNGFRYEDMPSDQEAYRLGLRAIDDMARRRFEMTFSAIGAYSQDLLLKSLHDGKPDPDHEVWKLMPVHRFWALMLEDCIDAYYAHPWAWDEIGFGGPAYPRGYMRLENGLPEPWEKDEVRYEWDAPSDSLSDLQLEKEADRDDTGHKRSN